MSLIECRAPFKVLRFLNIFISLAVVKVREIFDLQSANYLSSDAPMCAMSSGAKNYWRFRRMSTRQPVCHHQVGSSSVRRPLLRESHRLPYTVSSPTVSKRLHRFEPTFVLLWKRHPLNGLKSNFCSSFSSPSPLVTIGVSTMCIATLEPCLPIWLLNTFKPEKWQLGKFRLSNDEHSVPTKLCVVFQFA